jgi:hypothetical protein
LALAGFAEPLSRVEIVEAAASQQKRFSLVLSLELR